MLINNLPLIMIRALLLTIIIETITSIIVGLRDKKDILNVILVNVMTNPFVVSFPVYVNIRFGYEQRNITVLILEILTVLIEGFVYKKYLKYNKLNPYLLSLIFNASSYIIGEVINFIIY